MNDGAVFVPQKALCEFPGVDRIASEGEEVARPLIEDLGRVTASASAYGRQKRDLVTIFHRLARGAEPLIARKHETWAQIAELREPLGIMVENGFNGLKIRRFDALFRAPYQILHQAEK